MDIEGELDAIELTLDQRPITLSIIEPGQRGYDDQVLSDNPDEPLRTIELRIVDPPDYHLPAPPRVTS